MTQPSARTRALELAADYAVQAPSVHNTQPWRLELECDHLLIRADRSRRLSALDPRGRELVQSVGAALFNVRVALADAGWASDIERCPSPEDPDLLAVVRPGLGAPDPELAGLAPAVGRRRTNRRRFTGAHLPEAVLRRLTEVAESEGVLLVAVVDDAHRLLVARLTQQADGLQNADPAYRAELRSWTTRGSAEGDGVPPDVVPHVDGQQHDDVPLRDFDTGGTGGLPPETHSDIDQTMVLLATPTDDTPAWLRAGEALQHLLLELTRLGWVASPVTQPIEVPLTRTRLRGALTWAAHPQMLLRIGQARPTPRTPRRPRGDVVHTSVSPSDPSDTATPAPEPTTARHPAPAAEAQRRRAVPDGRGGTVWI
jgi:nitroreductase